MARAYIGTYNYEPGTPEEVHAETWLQHLHDNDPACCYIIGQVERATHYHVQFYMHFSTTQRLSAMKKRCPRTHWEPIKIDNGALEYCMKEDTRVEGPWEYGTKPCRLNKKRDVKARNKEILRLGPVKAVDEGLIDITKFAQAYRSIMLYNLMKEPPKQVQHQS